MILSSVTCSNGDDSDVEHLLVITMDTTRLDRLSAYGYGRETSPHLKALASRGIRFDQAYTSNPVTLPSHTTLFTGTYPFYHGVRDNGLFRVPYECVTLAERLQQSGFKTAAFVAAAVLGPTFGLDQGFDHYDADVPTTFSPTGHFPERSAQDMTDRVIAWLDREGTSKQTFIWAHYFDPHAPWQSPEPHRSALRDESVAYWDYDAEISYMDAQIGRLLEDLDRRGILENTWVIAVADHGEGLMDHGELTHGLYVYDETVRVPLIISGPRIDEPRIESRVVRTVDIVPTVLDALGISNPIDVPLHGHSLLDSDSLTSDAVAYSESYTPMTLFGWSWLESARKGTLKFIESPRAELYDLEKDPAEKKNLFADGNKSTIRMIEALSMEKTRTLPNEEEALSADVEASGELQAQLAALGYSAASLDETSKERGPDVKEVAQILVKKEHGTVLMNEGRFDEAEAIFTEIAKALPRKGIVEEMLALTHSNRARVLHERGKVEESNASLKKAIHHFQEQLKENPRYVLGHFNIAMAFDRLGERDKYVEQLRVCLDIDELYLPALYFLGVCRYEERSYSEALELFDRMLERWRPVNVESEPQGVDAMTRSGICLHRLERSEEALERLTRAENLLPAWPEPVFWKGVIAYERENFSASKSSLTRFIQSAGADPTLVRRAEGYLKRIERR